MEKYLEKSKSTEFDVSGYKRSNAAQNRRDMNRMCVCKNCVGVCMDKYFFNGQKREKNRLKLMYVT